MTPLRQQVKADVADILVKLYGSYSGSPAFARDIITNSLKFYVNRLEKMQKEIDKLRIGSQLTVGRNREMFISDLSRRLKAIGKENAELRKKGAE